MYSDIIYKDTNGKDGEYASDGIKASIRKFISTFAIHHIFPKPLSHRITVGVYHQHTESARRYGIDPLVMFHLQVLEIHKCRDGGDYSQEGVRVGYGAICPYLFTEIVMGVNCRKDCTYRHCHT